MDGFRDDIEALRQNGITRVAFPRLGDPSVIPLWFGEGDAVTPAFIREAAKAALDAGETFYVHTRGRETLRDAIKTYLDRVYAADIHPDRITVPGSAMLGVNIASQMALTTGTHGLVVTPHWPNIDTCFRIPGADVSYVRQRETASGWQLGADEIMAEVRPETRAIYVNTPCNPTGWVMGHDDIQALLAFCRERGIVIVADEVYHRTVVEGDVAPSFLHHAGDDDPVVVVNGFSKAWAMTGWRLGWVVAPRRHAEAWAMLSECFNTGSTVFAQAGGIAALEHGEGVVRELREQYLGGRQLMLDILGASPHLEVAAPAGAFYGFVRVNGLSSSLAYVERLLAEADVGTAPGFTFGPGNDAYFRICFANSHELLRRGLERIVEFTDRHANELPSWQAPED